MQYRIDASYAEIVEGLGPLVAKYSASTVHSLQWVAQQAGWPYKRTAAGIEVSYPATEPTPEELGYMCECGHHAQAHHGQLSAGCRQCGCLQFLASYHDKLPLSVTEVLSFQGGTYLHRLLDVAVANNWNISRHGTMTEVWK